MPNDDPAEDRENKHEEKLEAKVSFDPEIVSDGGVEVTGTIDPVKVSYDGQESGSDPKGNPEPTTSRKVGKPEKGGLLTATSDLAVNDGRIVILDDDKTKESAKFEYFPKTPTIGQRLRDRATKIKDGVTKFLNASDARDKAMAIKYEKSGETRAAKFTEFGESVKSSALGKVLRKCSEGLRTLIAPLSQFGSERDQIMAKQEQQWHSDRAVAVKELERKIADSPAGEFANNLRDGAVNAIKNPVQATLLLAAGGGGLAFGTLAGSTSQSIQDQQVLRQTVTRDAAAASELALEASAESTKVAFTRGEMTLDGAVTIKQEMQRRAAARNFEDRSKLTTGIDKQR